MFHQELTPVGASLPLSTLVAAVPVPVVLLLLGVLRRPARQASAAVLTAGLALAVLVWHFPAPMALDSVAAGAVFALWPVMGIVAAALLL
jgi:lactate permease